MNRDPLAPEGRERRTGGPRAEGRATSSADLGAGEIRALLPRPFPRALIKIGYGCNNHCTFCHTLERRHLDDTSENVERKIDRAGQLGFRTVVLSGGEPTIRPELLSWAGRSARRGLGLGLVTNARMLAYRDLVDRLLQRSLSYVHLSLHGGNAALHDGIVRAEAFQQTLASLSHLSGRGLDLTVNCVVTRDNISCLRELVDLLSAFEGLRLKFSMPEPRGGGKIGFDRIVPLVREAAAAIVDAVDHGRKRAPGLEFAHENLPLCLLPGIEQLRGDLRSSGFGCMSEVGEGDFHPVDDVNRVHGDRCRDCGLRGPCPGLFRGYHERRGDGELRPVRAVRANSFNYVPTGRFVWRTAAPCPLLRQGPTPHDRARSLFLRDGEQMFLFETGTRDFADEELRAVKWRTGQIYIDMSDKPALDDFSQDLRKLMPLDDCGRCAMAQQCAGCFRVVQEDLFARDQQSLARRIEALRGDVLDVGCGEGRYAAALAPAARSGLVRYCGVDPDAAAVKRLFERYPWAQTQVARAEELQLAAQSRDHILLLNSYNHLAAPETVLPVLVRALRPGGTLLLADNTAFGLLRTGPQAARAESSGAALEHHRNHGASEAAACLAHLPVTLIASSEVSPETSIQWFLHYRRLGDTPPEP